MQSYSKIKAQVERLQERRREILGKLAASEQEAARALLEGRDMPPLDDKLKAELERLDRAIELGQEQLAALELDRIYEDLAALQNSEAKLGGELAAARKVFEQAERVFREAEATFGVEHQRITRRLDDLSRTRMKLEAEAQALTTMLDPVLIEDAIPKFLAAFRRGEVKTFTEGQDPAQDEAYRLYQSEVRELRAWARKNALSKSTTGESVPLPSCAAYYTKAQIDALIRKAEKVGGGVEPKDDSGLLLEPKKVSI